MVSYPTLICDTHILRTSAHTVWPELQIQGLYSEIFFLFLHQISYYPSLEPYGQDNSNEGYNICFNAELPYFFGYKTENFFFQNNPKNLDLSYKTDLDLWDCLGRVKLVL